MGKIRLDAVISAAEPRRLNADLWFCFAL